MKKYLPEITALNTILNETEYRLSWRFSWYQEHMTIKKIDEEHVEVTTFLENSDEYENGSQEFIEIIETELLFEMLNNRLYEESETIFNNNRTKIQKVFELFCHDLRERSEKIKATQNRIKLESDLPLLRSSVPHYPEIDETLNNYNELFDFSIRYHMYLDYLEEQNQLGHSNQSYIDSLIDEYKTDKDVIEEIKNILN